MDDDVGENKGKQDKERGKGHLIVFPGGKKVSADDLGTPYVVGQGGNVSTPEIIDPSAAAREVKERERFVHDQPLSKSLARGATASELVDDVLKEIAEELAHLKFERSKAAREGKNTANYNMSRVAALKQIADVLMKRQENARAEQLDLKSPRFQAVLRSWMEFVYESMRKSSIPDADIELVFNQMKADMSEWEQQIISLERL